MKECVWGYSIDDLNSTVADGGDIRSTYVVGMRTNLRRSPPLVQDFCP
jgi:hypothetical protein